MANKIETPEEKKARETTETVARSLNALVDSVKALLNGPLKRKTLLVLLAHTTKLNQNDVDRVLAALEDLSNDWLN